MIHTPAPCRRAFSLAEAVAAVGLLGSCVLVVLTAASSAVARRQDAQSRAAAAELVIEILDEARALPYEEPGVTTTVLGMEAGESFTKRSSFDDVDDLNGWTENGIVGRDASSVSGMASWKREVFVEWVDAATGAVTQAAETGVKRVRAQVTRSGKLLASGAILRTKSWQEATP